MRTSIFAWIFLVTSTSFLTSGCALKDEGAIGFRSAIPGLAATGNNNYGVSGSKITCGKITNCIDISSNQNYSIISPDEGALILEGEYFIVQLKSGMVKQFVDIDEKGDIAILARLYETGVSETTQKHGTIDLGDAKLIFYSDDVHHGQYLNISQSLMFGPIEYHGRPVVLEIYGVDVDELSDGMKALVGSLISEGVKVASAVNPAAGTVAGVVGNLGEAMLSGNSDDIIFAYRMSFAANHISKYVPQDYFLESERVFVRANDRATQFHWDEVGFDPGSAKLLYLKDSIEQDGHKAGDEFRDETYFVVDIVRTAPADYPIESESYSALLEKIRASGPISPEDAEDLSKSIETAVNEGLYRSALSNKLALVRDPGQLPAKRAIALRDFLETLKNLQQGDAKSGGTILPESEQQQYIDALRLWIARTHPKTYEGFLNRLDNLAAEQDLYAFAREMLAQEESPAANPS